MKILKFNEKLSTAEVEFAENFKGSLVDIMDYLLTVYKETKLSKTDVNDILNSKAVETYLSVDQEIQKLEKQVEELHKNKDYYELDATSEAVYMVGQRHFHPTHGGIHSSRRLISDRGSSCNQCG